MCICAIITSILDPSPNVSVNVGASAGVVLYTDGHFLHVWFCVLVKPESKQAGNYSTVSYRRTSGAYMVGHAIITVQYMIMSCDNS